MGSDAESATPASPPPANRRRTVTRLAFLAFGLGVALYLGTQGPQEQHVRIVLGVAAPDVTAMDLRYLGGEGELLREVHFTYPDAPPSRVVSHEPKLPNGEYQLQIDVQTRRGRRDIQRQVTLGGGSTQVDVSSALTRVPTGESPSDAGSSEAP